MFELQGSTPHSGNGMPREEESYRGKANALKTERDRVSTKSYAEVEAAAPAQATKIQLSGAMDQKMLACMLHTHLVNMGSPGNQETLNRLFTVNRLTPIVIPHKPYSMKIFGILPGEKCQPNNFKINTEVNKTQQKAKEPESSAMEVQVTAA